MMRATVGGLFTLLALSSAAAELHAQTRGSQVEIGEWFTMRSNVLDEDRRYSVYLPTSYHDTTYAPQHYPVLYLLDGDAHFHSATGVVQFMSTGINGNIQIPELIVVAIPNTNRTRDLTPTHTTVGYDGNESAFLEASGGGNEFLEFIRTELFPEIDSTYRTRDYRIFVGHSLGGLMALHALLEVPDMFDAYIAIDPSLWWDDQALVERAKQPFSNDPSRHAAVYISMANNPDVGRGDPMVMRRAGSSFARALERTSTDGIRSALRYFPNEDHGSVPLVSLYHGLLHVFEGYKPSIAAFIENPGELQTHFDTVSQRLGITLLPPEAVVHQMGMAMLYQLEDFDAAIALLELNASQYPESYNAHSRLGDAYAKNDQITRAIESYQRSLELKPGHAHARDQLEKLRSQGR